MSLNHINSQSFWVESWAKSTQQNHKTQLFWVKGVLAGFLIGALRFATMAIHHNVFFNFTPSFLELIVLKDLGVLEVHQLLG